MIQQSWIEAFDSHLRKFFGVDHTEVGLYEGEMILYNDLDPREAALVYGEENDLTRIDRGW